MNNLWVGEDVGDWWLFNGVTGQIYQDVGGVTPANVDNDPLALARGQRGFYDLRQPLGGQQSRYSIPDQIAGALIVPTETDQPFENTTILFPPREYGFTWFAFLNIDDANGDPDFFRTVFATDHVRLEVNGLRQFVFCRDYGEPIRLVSHVMNGQHLVIIRDSNAERQMMDDDQIYEVENMLPAQLSSQVGKSTPVGYTTFNWLNYFGTQVPNITLFSMGVINRYITDDEELLIRTYLSELSFIPEE